MSKTKIPVGLSVDWSLPLLPQIEAYEEKEAAASPCWRRGFHPEHSKVPEEGKKFHVQTYKSSDRHTVSSGRNSMSRYDVVAGKGKDPDTKGY